MANLWLEQGFRLHTSPAQLERARVIGRMYGQYNVRPGWWYAHDPYAQVVAEAGLRGLGFDYWDLYNASGREDCDPKDSGCVGRNIQRQAAATDLWMTYMTNPNTANMPTPDVDFKVDRSDAALAAFMNNQPVEAQVSVNDGAFYNPFIQSTQNPSALPYGYVPPKTNAGGAAPVTQTGYSPRVVFSTSTGNTSQLKPGDTWTMRITGAQPGSYVYVTGGQNGKNDTTQMGTTDAAGNWSASGSIDTTMIGNWREAWKAGGMDAGQVNFTVVAATQAQQSAATGKPNASVPPGNELIDLHQSADGTVGGGTGVPPEKDNTMLYLIAAGAALFLFTQGRK